MARDAARSLSSAPLSPLGRYAISPRAHRVIRRQTKWRNVKIKRSVAPQAAGQHPSRRDPVMTDPLSLAASVVALVHAVRVGGKQLHKLRSYYHAPPEIARLRAQMVSLGQLLDAVQSFVRGDNSAQMARHSSDLLGLPVEVATARVASVNKILNSPAFGLSRLSDANKARATIIRYKGRLASLEREIKESISEIGVRLSFVTAYATGQIPQIGQSLNICLKFQEVFSERLLSSFDKLAISQFETLAGAQLEAAQSPKAFERQETEMTQLKIGQRRQTNSSVRTLPQYTAEEGALREDPEQPAFKKRYDCRPGCNCACHIKRDFSSSWLLNSLLGELSIHWRSQKPEVRCNCSGHTGFAVIYRFPQYLLQRYISMILQTTYLDGPELILRVPRVLPWTHLLWRYSVCGDLKAIKKMYAERTASPYDVDPAGRNALLYASKQQSAKVVQFLLDQNADSNQIDNQGRAPSELLLKRSFGRMYGEHSTNIMRRILNNDDSFEEFGFTTLHKIVLGLDCKELKTVLDATTDTINMPDSIGRSALFWAVICDSEDHVRLLLDYGADPNANDLRGYTPVDFVRGPSVCRLLLEKGAENNVNPNNYHHSSLHEQVIENGCPEVMSLFAAKGFDVDITDDDNETPLLNAIYAGHTAVVKLLIELGANVNNANLSSRDSALHFAANFDRPAILKMLLAKGADYTALDYNGRSLAHCAARTASTECVKIMAEANLLNLDLGLKDYEGKTPGDYMSERVVMTDGEVGVHEAWEDLVASLALPSPEYTEQDVGKEKGAVAEVMHLEELNWTAGCLKLPGAFPIETIREVGTFAA